MLVDGFWDFFATSLEKGLAHRRGAWLVKACPRADNPMFTTAQKRWASLSTPHGQCVVRERQPRPGKLGVVALAASWRTPGCQPQDMLQTHERAGGGGAGGRRGGARVSLLFFVFMQVFLRSIFCLLL